MKTRKGLFIILLLISLLLNGCSMSFSSIDLIHPPKTIGNEAEIQSLIDENAKEQYILKYPQNGEHRSAIVMEDLNNDETPEAIAFYRTQGDKPTTHLLIMQDKGDKWKIIYNYKTPYENVDCIQFADYDYDGNKEFFTGFCTYTNGVNQLEVFDYDIESQKINHIETNKLYSSLTTGDFDKDGAPEAMLLTLSTADTDSTATLLDYDNNVLYTLAYCNLDYQVTKFENVVSGMIDDKNYGVAIDGLLTDTYNTQVLFYDTEEQSLINSFYQNNTSTEKNHLIKSQDIDKDDFIEIATLSYCVLPKKIKESTPSSLITWKSFNTSTYQLDFDNSCLFDFDFNYSFNLPSNFIGTTTALLSKDGRTMNIYELTDNNSANQLLVTFKIFDISATPEQTTGFSTLTKNNKYIYTYKIPDENPSIYIDDKIIKSNFIYGDINNNNTL